MQGWSMLKNEFLETFREISLLGFGLLFIAHRKEKTAEGAGPNGEALTTVSPDLPSSGLSIINSLVDFITYLEVEMKPDGTRDRWLYLQPTPTIMARSRYPYLKPRIPFSYQNLVDAIGEAIDEQEKHGAQVVDHSDNGFVPMTARPFNETMKEARELWDRVLLASGDSDEAVEAQYNKLSKIVKRIFGDPNVRLSEVSEDQQELLEAFIEEAKTLIN